VSVQTNSVIGRQLARDHNGHVLPVLRLTDRGMVELPEYSASIPTGKVIGKRWKCRLNREGTHWVIGGYEELSEADKIKWPGEIAILWFIPVVDGAAPGVWEKR
jgi:hypothetical protein